jgi:hypothetical protein
MDSEVDTADITGAQSSAPNPAQSPTGSSVTTIKYPSVVLSIGISAFDLTTPAYSFCGTADDMLSEASRSSAPGSTAFPRVTGFPMVDFAATLGLLSVAAPAPPLV